MNDQVRLLIAHYKASFSVWSEKQKAEAERDLWMVFKAANPEYRGGKREWLKTTLEGPSLNYEHRSQLIMAGPWVNQLWTLLDEHMTYSTVITLFRLARDRMSKTQIPGEEAVRQVVEEYNSQGHIAKTPDGRVYRKMTPLERQRTQPPPSMILIGMDMDAPQNKRSKQFMSRLVALADEYVRTSLTNTSHIDEMMLKIAKDEFTSFVREACDDLRRRVYNLRSSSKKDLERLTRVTRSQIQEASEVLGISIVWGGEVDLRKAKKIMLRRCAQLHPDKTGSMTEEQKTEYTAVVNAYKTIERYMEGRKSNAAGERSHGE
jgi:hypothetical protein